MIGDPELFEEYIKINTTEVEKRLEGMVARIVPTEFFDIFTEGGQDQGKMHPPSILPENYQIVDQVFGEFSYNGKSMRDIINHVLDAYYSQRRLRVIEAHKNEQRLDSKNLLRRKNGMPYEMHLIGTAEFLATHLGGPPFGEHERGLIVTGLLHDTIEDLPISLDWAFFNIDRFTELAGQEVMNRVAVMTNFYKHIMPEVDERMGDEKRSDSIQDILNKMFHIYNRIEEEYISHKSHIEGEIRELRFVAEMIAENPAIIMNVREITPYKKIRRYMESRTHPKYAEKIVAHDRENGDLVSLVKICDILHNTATPDGETEDKIKLIRKNLDYLDVLCGILKADDSEYNRAFSRVAYLTLELACEQMQKCKDSADPTNNMQDALRHMFVRLVDYATLVLMPYKVDPLGLRRKYDLNKMLYDDR